MMDELLMVDEDGISVVPMDEAMEIARRKAAAMIQQMAEDLCSVQPMNADVHDGLRFLMGLESKS